ncbi:VOC family protein [Streptomyces sp. NPDC003077]|uniref:VOC family protein n=1 Tax=Streptomyces sp. NPDC003077 TaxID=3154443 RepID=UPI0033A5D819
MPRLDVEADHTTGRTGIPSIRRVDHFAFTVKDLDAAVRFLAEVLGGELCYIEGPVQDPQGDWMSRKLGVHPRAVAHVAMVRVGPHTNLELFQYTAPRQRTAAVPLDGPGGRRMALRVEDVDAVAARLRRRPDTTVTCDAVCPTVQPGRSVRRVGFTTSWGMELQLCGTADPLDARSAAASPSAAGPAKVLGADHLALTVGDLAASVRFFTDVIGASPLPPRSPRERSGAPTRAHLRLGPTDRIELRQYEGNGVPPAPGNSDVGGSHLAFHVDDVDTAAAYLRSQPGVRVMGEPETITGGPIEGNRWVYFTTPIGVQMEILRMPDGRLPYERTTAARRASSHSFVWA